MKSRRSGPLGTRLMGAAVVGLLGGGCTLHHVRDGGPVVVPVGGVPATVLVETAAGNPAPDGSRDGQRILVTLDRDLRGAAEREREGRPSAEQARANAVALRATDPDVALVTAQGAPPERCRRLSLPAQSEEVGTRAQLLFECQAPPRQPLWLRGPGAQWQVPVLTEGGLPVIGAQPWMLSTWVRGELAGRVTGPPAIRTIDLGVNLGVRGLLLRHISLGGRADILVDSGRTHGQALFGPEMGYAHPTWPCARCSVEATASYLFGSDQGFASGPEADVRFGLRLGRTGVSWHGIEAGLGYRHLLGQDAGGSVVATISYSLQTALRWGFLPGAVRAASSQMPAPRPAPILEE